MELLQPDAPRENLREFIDKIRDGGFQVVDQHTADPDLIDPQGKAFAQQLLEFPVPVPSALAETLNGAHGAPREIPCGHQAARRFIRNG